MNNLPDKGIGIYRKKLKIKGFEFSVDFSADKNGGVIILF